MKQPKQLVDIITKGIQEKKGQDIVTVGLSNIEGAIANHFVTCQGNSLTQVKMISESIGGTVREDLKEKPVNTIGLGTNQWVAIDFTDVLVHIFLSGTGAFHDLENLWENARLTRVPDQDQINIALDIPILL